VLFKSATAAQGGRTGQGKNRFILTVGERQGEIEVLAIDPKAGTVVVRKLWCRDQPQLGIE